MRHWPTVASLTLMVLTSAADSARATPDANGRIWVKEGSPRVTGFWRITENTYYKYRNRDLRGRVLTNRPDRFPRRLRFSMTWYIFAECNHNERAPVQQERPVTAGSPEFIVRCP